MASTGANSSYLKALYYDARKHLYINWHRLSSQSLTLARLGFIITKAALLLIAPLTWALNGGWHRGIAVVGGYFVLVILHRASEFSPDHMPFVTHGYAQRKADFTAALMVLGKRLRAGGMLNDAEKEQIRGYALGLIVSYVRGHRKDLKEKKIYATLLAEEGDSLKVIKRSDRDAKPDEVHPKDSMLAWRTIAERRITCTGDVRNEFSSTPVGKAYNSVMALPVFPLVANTPNPKPIAAVAVVSSEPFHFDLHIDEFETSLMPYIRLLSITL